MIIKHTRRGHPMWVPIGEDRMVLALLAIAGVVAIASGIIAGELGRWWGSPVATTGIVLSIGSGIRIWWLERTPILTLVAVLATTGGFILLLRAWE